MLELALWSVFEVIFFHCFNSWFYKNLKRIAKSHRQSIFPYYKFIHTCVLFAILLSYNFVHFKSSREKREKKRVLVYIFVRENSDIYRQTQGSLLVLWNLTLENWCKYSKYAALEVFSMHAMYTCCNVHVLCTAGFCVSIVHVDLVCFHYGLTTCLMVFTWVTNENWGLNFLNRMPDNALARFCAIISPHIVRPSTLYIFIARFLPFRVQFKCS